SAQHSVSADIVVRLDHDDGCSLITRHDSGRKPGSAGPDNDNIRSPIPPNPVLGRRIRFLHAQSSKSSCADAYRCASLDELSSTDVEFFLFFAHGLFSLTKECWNVFGPKASAGLRVGGFTRVHFHIDVVGREQRPVAGNHTNSVVTWYVETDLCFRCE